LGAVIQDGHGAARGGVPTLAGEWGEAEESEFSGAYRRMDSVSELRAELLQ